MSELFHGGNDFRIDADTGIDDEASLCCMSNANSAAGSGAQQACDVPRGIYGVAGNAQRTCQDVGAAGGNCRDGRQFSGRQCGEWVGAHEPIDNLVNGSVAAEGNNDVVIANRYSRDHFLSMAGVSSEHGCQADPLD